MGLIGVLCLLLYFGMTAVEVVIKYSLLALRFIFWFIPMWIKTAAWFFYGWGWLLYHLTVNKQLLRQIRESEKLKNDYDYEYKQAWQRDQDEFKLTIPAENYPYADRELFGKLAVCIHKKEYDKIPALENEIRTSHFNNINHPEVLNANENRKLYEYDDVKDLLPLEQNKDYQVSCDIREINGIFVILAQSLPLITLVNNLLKLIAKLFKSSSINRKMTELLFENLTEKPNKFENYLEELKAKKNSTNKFENNNIISIADISQNLQNISSLVLFKNKDKECPKEDRKEDYGPKDINNKVKITNKKSEKNDELINSLINYKRMSLRFKEPIFHKKKRFVANKLFPFRYYFWAVFVKNIDLTKNRFFLSKKFIKVYCFLCQLFDISSYCVLQKEFNVMKNSLFDENNIHIIEKTGKINVNGQSFMKDMSEAIEKNKFNILGKNIKRKNDENKSQLKDKNKI